MLRTRSPLALCASRPGPFLQLGYVVHRGPGQLNQPQGSCISIDQIKVRHFTKQDLYSLSNALSCVGGLVRPPRFSAQAHNLRTISWYPVRQLRDLPVPWGRLVV